MKYAPLIYSNDEEWDTLSADEQQAICGGRIADARDAYSRALDLAHAGHERRFLQDWLTTLESPR